MIFPKVLMVEKQVGKKKRQKEYQCVLDISSDSLIA